MHEIGRAYGRPHPTIRKLLLPVGHRSHGASSLALALTSLSEKIFREGSLPTRRFARSPWSESCHLDSEPRDRTPWRPSAYRAMMRTDKLGSRLCDPSAACWHEPQVADIVAGKLILDWSPSRFPGG